MVDKRKHAETSGEASSGQVKRQRVSRACDQCRAAREKCDGIQPMCFTCASSNRNCTYTTPPKKRGIQPGYIRTLELALAWIFENNPGSESALKSGLSQDQAAGVLSGRDADGSAKLHKSWRRSAACKELERILGKAEHAPTPDSPSDTPHNHDIGAGDSPRVAADGSFLAKLPRNLWRLLDIYYAYTHTWLPIIQKHDMLKLAYTYGDDGLRLVSEENPEHAELWALLAIAAVQEENVTSTAATDRNSQEVYDTARRLIPNEQGKPTVNHVKALVLLTLINIGSEKWTVAWLLLGQAINIAIDVNAQNVPPPDDSRFQHSVLACSMLESLLCSHLNRLPRSASLDLASIGAVREDGLEEWQPWASCDGFGQESGKESGIPTSRTPNHSLSIFNQLVMLSSSAQGMSLPPNLDRIPVHLRFIDRRASSPQLVHLHILHGCIIGAASRVSELLSEYAQHFGATAMPTVFHLYASLLKKRANDAVEANTVFQNIFNSLGNVWGSQSDTHISKLEHSIVNTPSPPAQRKYSNLPAVGESAPTYPTLARVDTSMSAGRTFPPPVPQPHRLPADESNHLQRYTSHPSVDLEALFDEIASLDGTDNPDHQPLFMQNLGLAPNADLNDVFASDFGFDPLLSTYMNPVGISVDQSRGYPAG